MKYIDESGIETFLDNELGDAQSAQVAQAFIDTLRSRIDEVKEKDNKWEKVVKKERRRRTMRVDSDLSNFIID